MANTTGKKARKRLGTRHAAKRVGSGVVKGSKPKKARKVFGKLSHSVERGNADSVVRDNAAFTERIARQREEIVKRKGFGDVNPAEANVAVG